MVFGVIKWFWSELEVGCKTVAMSENLGTVGANGFQTMLDEEMEMPVWDQIEPMGLLPDPSPPLPLDQLELLDVFLDPSPPARNQEEGLWEDKGEMLLKIPDLLVSFNQS